MRNIKLTIEYDGTDYNGWQIQHKNQKRKGGRVKTIQGAIEGAIFNLLGERVKLISCGRTDSGVHAESHIANFKSFANLGSAQIKRALNALMPPDIVIKEVKEARSDFHSQYDAISKTYRYTISNGEYISPFLRRYAYHFRQPLDVSLMKREAAALLGRHDFSAFKSSSKSDDGNERSAIRTIKRLDIKKKGRMIEIRIEADGFLYNMARNIVGTLIEAGRGKFFQGSLRRILKKKDRTLAGHTAPAKGLCLVNVEYA